MKIGTDEINVLAEAKKIVSGGARKFDFEPTDEELRKAVRRAVKSVAVPVDLEAKVLKLLSKQL